jgi:DNA-binding transcriptional ArsR family regulator
MDGGFNVAKRTNATFKEMKKAIKVFEKSCDDQRRRVRIFFRGLADGLAKANRHHEHPVTEPSQKKLNRWVDNPSGALMLNHMVEQFAHLDAVFRALADPTRRAMLGQLAERELTIGELATPFSMSFAGASKHVRVLENAGLVTRTIRGRTHLCRLQAARLAEADAWLRRYERFWNQKLDRLESLLRAEDEAKAKKN